MQSSVLNMLVIFMLSMLMPQLSVGTIHATKLETKKSERQITLEEIENDPIEMIIHPNPATALVHIEILSPQSSHLEISLFDILGRRIFNNSEFSKEGSNRITIDLSDLKAGHYLVKVDSEHGSLTRKLLKRV